MGGTRATMRSHRTNSAGPAPGRLAPLAHARQVAVCAAAANLSRGPQPQGGRGPRFSSVVNDIPATSGLAARSDTQPRRRVARIGPSTGFTLIIRIALGISTERAAPPSAPPDARPTVRPLFISLGVLVLDPETLTPLAWATSACRALTPPTIVCDVSRT